MLKRQVIKATGAAAEILVPITIPEAEKAIGALFIDTFNLRDSGGHVMLIDREAKKKGLPVNEVATGLFWAHCRPGSKHTIRGDVVIVPNNDYERSLV